jgi:hypothetical protein
MSGLRWRICWRFLAWRLFFAGCAFAGSVLAGLVLLGQGFDHRADGAFEFGQVVVDSRLQDRMSGVEVAVGQVIAHAGDLAPWDGGLGSEQFGGQGLDGLPDFQQPYRDRVEDQAIGQIAALQVGAAAGRPRSARPSPGTTPGS